MAQDQVQVMSALGFDSFDVCGHDRGARVAHRMALDHPQRVRKVAFLDIVPTHHALNNIRKKVDKKGVGTSGFTPGALAEYIRCCTPESIHAVCEDYRAAVGIDFVHDKPTSRPSCRCRCSC